ncbi:hypothetical protein GUITHDRAFT_109793 [Guillardia theta CCMP2712]|uniref:Uncharacterized protein n=1 Tax=Guillardia theta (strain CCMP2712) TaxID=905079 RepID=L1J733_GUITC|nr:hypothetical protein GUITHDRAFT_109793 [Guillardia theta CCMP2712]EKX44343.1 hypothetical protein GUITHDRAFT_109793 [Guillardia theta CCMP2712]|eukprot:XP_005831323.1 hypothetical protein GUITHDRAFT_109793 [Guillardia theta CCMP2712]
MSTDTRPRARISDRIACEIYLFRLSQPSDQLWFPTPASVALGRRYGITPKAVRDIWNRRTWARATRHLWKDKAGQTMPLKQERQEGAGSDRMLNEEEEVVSTLKPELRMEEQIPSPLSPPSRSPASIPATDDIGNEANIVESQSNEATGLGDRTADTHCEGWLVCPTRILLFISAQETSEDDIW